MALEVHIERPFQRDTIQVWVIDRGRGRNSAILRLFDPGGEGFLGFPEWVELTEATEGRPPPTLELPTDAAEALAGKLLDVLPPSTSQERHLADTIEVRDRLFNLVERLIPSPFAAPVQSAPPPSQRGGPIGPVE